MGGVRVRFRKRGAAARLGAAFGAIYVAVALGALGGFLGWRTAPPLPDDAEAVRLAQPAFLPGATPEPRRWEFTFDDSPKYTDPRWVYLIGGTDEYERGRVFFTFTHANRTPAGTVVAGARQRMRAAGWQPVLTDMSGCCPYSALRRDGWLVEISSQGYADDSHSGLEVAVSRTTPGAVLSLSGAGLLVGALVGALAGWLTTAWAIRRGRTRKPLRRALAVALSGAAACALFPATAMSAAALGTNFASRDGALNPPPWLGYTFWVFRPLAYLGALAVAVALLLIALPGGRRESTP